jgi:hypothetical protein
VKLGGSLCLVYLAACDTLHRVALLTSSLASPLMLCSFFVSLAYVYDCVRSFQSKDTDSLIARPSVTPVIHLDPSVQSISILRFHPIKYEEPHLL